MGGPKALMRVDGRAWWEWQCERLARLGGEVVWIVTDEVGTSMEEAARARGVEVRLVRVEGGRPMFDSVRAGIECVYGEAMGSGAGHERDASEGVFVLPVDVPAAGAEVWSGLRREGGGASGRPRQAPVSPSVVDESGAVERGHPIYLPREWVVRVFAAAVREAGVRGTLGELRLDRLIEPERVLHEVRDMSVVTNLNTPGDVEAWLRGREEK